MLLHCLQSLSDVRIDPGVHESDAPVLDVAVQQFQVLAALGQNEVIGGAFVVVEKVVLDDVRPIAHAEDEVPVSEVGVILHHVPQQRPVADVHHRFRQIVGIADPHAEASTEQDDFHDCVAERCLSSSPSQAPVAETRTLGCRLPMASTNGLPPRRRRSTRDGSGLMRATSSAPSPTTSICSGRTFWALASRPRENRETVMIWARLAASARWARRCQARWTPVVLWVRKRPLMTMPARKTCSLPCSHGHTQPEPEPHLEKTPVRFHLILVQGAQYGSLVPIDM